MISTNDLKNGITIEYEGNIYVVMETQPAETPNATKEPVQESTVPEVEVTTQNINQNM